MPNVVVRNLGGAGVISDLNVYDLPPNALSAGVNVRFENGKITRAPLFRRVHQFSESNFQPQHIFSIPATSAVVETVVSVDKDFSPILSLVGNTVTDVTPLAGHSPSSSNLPFTHCFLAGVAYVNRATHVPLAFTPGATDFVALANWNSNWRCRVLRSFKDTLVALSVIKAGTVFPTMVKWSDFAQYGAVPPSWDETSTTNSAGENPLGDMKGELLDGLELNDNFILYSENEVWSMTYIGGPFVFDFRKRFSDRGIIGANCVVEVEGMHYVFDRNDIYVHDGNQPRSIIHGQNKDFVFGSLVKEQSERCFVTHDPQLNEIRFCYVSDDSYTGFAATATGANRAAVYNYRRNSWTFYDLPNVTSATIAGVVTGQTYEQAGTTTYAEMGGTYIGNSDEAERYVLFAGHSESALGLTSPRVYALTPASNGRLTLPVENEALRGSFVERIGIDLDENGSPLTSYKSLLAMYPQVEIAEPADVLEFQFGASDLTGVSPTWTNRQRFRPEQSNKIDVRVAGRYLAYRMYFTGLSDFALSGFDANIVQRGNR